MSIVYCSTISIRLTIRLHVRQSDNKKCHTLSWVDKWVLIFRFVYCLLSTDVYRSDNQKKITTNCIFLNRFYCVTMTFLIQWPIIYEYFYTIQYSIYNLHLYPQTADAVQLYEYTHEVSICCIGYIYSWKKRLKDL